MCTMPQQKLAPPPDMIRKKLEKWIEGARVRFNRALDADSQLVFSYISGGINAYERVLRYIDGFED